MTYKNEHTGMIKLQLDSFCPISGTARFFLHLPLTDNWYAALVAYESKTLNISKNYEREKQLLNVQKPTGEHTNC